MMSYSDALAYLYASQPAFHLVGSAAYKPGFDNTNRLLSALGMPHTHFRSVHVAGTNGKGSTSHLLAAVLQEAGYKVGLYTSPHLVDFGERIRINGQKIAQNYVVDFVEKWQPLLEEVKPSFFETAMAMAFAYFADKQVDIAVVEVGLGGRLDSTNVISPLLSVITNIGMDHMQFLGNTLPQIASEKAGIIKLHTPVVIGETQPETQPVFVQKAAQMQAPIVFADAQTTPAETLACQLTGLYQQKNRQTAYVAIEQLRKVGLQISEEALRKGFAQVCTLTGLQGRWQQLGQHPTIICDTGHNSHGIRYVAQQLSATPCRTLRMVFGMAADKDIDIVLALLPKQATYYLAQANTPRAMAVDEFSQMATAHGLSVHFAGSVPDAYQLALSEAHPDDLVFVGGSNFVVGEVLQLLANSH